MKLERNAFAPDFLQEPILQGELVFELRASVHEKVNAAIKIEIRQKRANALQEIGLEGMTQ